MGDLKSGPGERVEINTKNGATLVGDFFESSSDKGIIMFPGITEHRSSLYSFAKKLNQDGFKVWDFDLNSQGESTGNWDITEMQESAHYIQRHLKRRYDLKRIGAFGNSVGAMAVGLASSRQDSDLECLCLIASPSSLDKVVPRTLLKLGKYIPQGLVRAVAIGFDKIQADLLKNEKYRRKTHPLFKTPNGYQPYAQFGALKISDLGDMTESALVTLKLSDYTQYIHQPTLLVYGGEDSFIGIKNSQLPAHIRNMYDSLGSENKKLVIVPGASHALNTPPMKADDCLNEDPKYSWVKEEVNEHFCKYLL